MIQVCSEATSRAYECAGDVAAALDQHMVKADAAISGASEFAIFPPVTGG